MLCVYVRLSTIRCKRQASYDLSVAISHECSSGTDSSILSRLESDGMEEVCGEEAALVSCRMSRDLFCWRFFLLMVSQLLYTRWCSLQHHLQASDGLWMSLFPEELKSLISFLKCRFDLHCHIIVLLISVHRDVSDLLPAESVQMFGVLWVSEVLRYFNSVWMIAGSGLSASHQYFNSLFLFIKLISMVPPEYVMTVKPLGEYLHVLV